MSSVTWGLATGIAAVSCIFVARLIIRRLSAARGPIRTAVALGATFAVYETALFTLAVAGLGGGTGSFAAPIVGRVLAINVAAFAGLYALHRIGFAVGIGRPPAIAKTRPRLPAS